MVGVQSEVRRAHTGRLAPFGMTISKEDVPAAHVDVGVVERAVHITGGPEVEPPLIGEVAAGVRLFQSKSGRTIGTHERRTSGIEEFLSVDDVRGSRYLGERS